MSEAAVRVRISELREGDSPRLNGVDADHAKMLAGIDAALPPILVHHETMRVIDGMHRLQAARINGHTEIDVRLFYGSLADAFLLGVRANVTHGLPLSPADRRAAAARILAAHPEMSDRSVATAAGLSTRTVAGIRRRTINAATPYRLSRDGRTRPLSTVEGRRVASEIFAERPESSLREVARLAGVSVGTARDVRRRIESGGATAGSDHGPSGIEPSSSDLATLIQGLRRDPSIRYSERGRAMLRWLSLRVITVNQCREVLDSIPPHGAYTLARIAQECAEVWTDFAQELERRNAEST